MAIVSCKKIGAGRNGDNTKDRHRTYTVVFRVVVDSPLDGPGTVVLATGIPGLYTPYVGYENTSDTLALCVGVKPDQDGDEWQRWRVTCQFTTNWAQNNPNQQQNPEDEPVNFWVETEFTTRQVTREWNNTAILNSAGQFIDGLERYDSIETWVWEKNFVWLNRGTWKAYQNSVNSDSVGEIEPKQGLLHIIVPPASYRDGRPFWRVQFRVKINKDKWTVRPLDKGTRVKNGQTPPRLERPVDDLGRPFDGLVNLKSDGTQELDPDTEPRALPEKNLYEPKPFAALGVFT